MNGIGNFPCHLSSLLPQEGTILTANFDFDDPEALSKYKDELRVSMKRLRLASENIKRQVGLVTNRQRHLIKPVNNLPIILGIADKTMGILALPCGKDNLEEIAA